MHTGLFLASEESASLVMPSENEEDRRRRREALDARNREEGRALERRGSVDALSSISGKSAKGKNDADALATPSFDDVAPFADHLCGPATTTDSRRPLLSRRPLVHPSDRSVNIPDRSGRLQLPAKREMMVRYHPAVQNVAARSRLFCGPKDQILNPVVPASKKQTSKTKAAGTASKRVGCFIGGSASLEPYATCIVANAMPETSPPPQIAPAMQLLRVALCHLRTVGLLPYLLDVEYLPQYAKVTLNPQQLHPTRFSTFPVTSIRVYPTLARLRVMSDQARILRFDALPEAQDCDAVLAFAFDSDVVGDNPWEPSFVERECRYAFFTGPSTALGAHSGLSTGDHEAHREAMAVSPTWLADVPFAAPSSACRMVKFSLDTTRLQAPYEAFDVSSGELGSKGFGTVWRWDRFASELHTSLFTAVHRLWYIIQYRQHHNSLARPVA
jgi:hypothetical protein